MPVTTLLGLDRPGFSLPQYAARGIQMTLAPIDSAGGMFRDINGNLVVTAGAQFRKYKATISCTDQESPGFAEMSSEFDAIFPGDDFTVTCVPHLGTAEQLVLSMKVVSWNISRDEYEVDTGWSMSLEEG